MLIQAGRQTDRQNTYKHTEHTDRQTYIHTNRDTQHTYLWAPINTYIRTYIHTGRHTETYIHT